MNRQTIGIGVVLMAAGVAFATPDYSILINHSWGSIPDVPNGIPASGGGEFQVDVLPGSTGPAPARTGTAFQFAPAAAGRFETFCVEKFENIFVPGIYDADISTHTLSSTPAAYGTTVTPLHGGPADPLDHKTAYLYSNFIKMTLAGYDYTPGMGRELSAIGLQLAIWTIEEEMTPAELALGAAGGVPGYAEGAAFYADALANAGPGIGNVRILNVYTESVHTDYQDLLIFIPLPGQSAMAGVGLLGLLGCGAIRRRTVR